MRDRFRCIAVVCGIFISAAATRGQDADGPGELDRSLEGDSRARLSLAPYLWMPNLEGDIRSGSTQVELDVPFIDALRDTDEIVAAMGTIDFGTPEWGVFFDARQVGLSDSSSLGASMDSPLELGVNFDVAIIEAGARWRLIGDAADPGRLQAPGLSVLAGVRATEVDLGFRLGSLPLVDDSETWIEPFVGASWNVSLSENLGARLRGDVGGFGLGAELSLQGQAALVWETGWFNASTALYAGYRAIYQRYESGSFEWDMLLHGPMLGIGIRF
jgi:hypothetical protein